MSKWDELSESEQAAATRTLESAIQLHDATGISCAEAIKMVRNADDLPPRENPPGDGEGAEA